MGWDLATTTTAPLRTAPSPSGGEGGEGATLQESFDSMARLEYNYPGQRQISKKYCDTLHCCVRMYGTVVYYRTSLLLGDVDVCFS